MTGCLSKCTCCSIETDWFFPRTLFLQLTLLCLSLLYQTASCWPSLHVALYFLTWTEDAGGIFELSGENSPWEACADWSAEVVPVQYSVSFTVPVSLAQSYCSVAKRDKNRLGSPSRALGQLRLLPRQAWAVSFMGIRQTPGTLYLQFQLRDCGVNGTTWARGRE